MNAAPDNRPLLSLCMIVRDNVRTIGACLESIRPWVDEMVVVDTGSVDETPAICQRLGARVHSFPWVDDFSAARNESLRQASGKWLFWMDSDDTIPPACGRRLRALAEGAHGEDVLGYVMQVHCPGPEEEVHEMTVVDHVKLIRNRPELRFEGRIHEQIIPSIRGVGGDIGWTDIYVAHSGVEHTEQARQKKYDRDLRLLELDLRDRPGHPFVLFNLGMTHNDMDRHEEAVIWLTKCLEASRPQESHVRKAYALLVASLTHLRRYDQAQALSQKGKGLFPKDPELQFREGILAHCQGRLEDAVVAYKHALANDDERHFASIDPGIVSHKARHNLALVYQEQKRDDLAELQWRLAEHQRPDFKAGRVALAQSLMRRQRLAAAAVMIENLALQPPAKADAGLLTAELRAKEGRPAEARRLLDELVRRHGERREVHDGRCKFLFETASPSESEAALREMVSKFPQDGAAWHNLALIYLAQGKSTEAIKALRTSLAVRPDAPQTRRQLEQLLVQEKGHGH